MLVLWVVSSLVACSLDFSCFSRPAQRPAFSCRNRVGSRRRPAAHALPHIGSPWPRSRRRPPEQRPSELSTCLFTFATIRMNEYWMNIEWKNCSLLIDIRISEVANVQGKSVGVIQVHAMISNLVSLPAGTPLHWSLKNAGQLGRPRGSPSALPALLVAPRIVTSGLTSE